MGLFLKLLGAADCGAGALLLLSGVLDAPTRIFLLLGAALILKGLAFRGTVVSTIDAFLGVYVILASAWGGIGALNILFGLYLLLKGIYSFV